MGLTGKILMEARLNELFDSSETFPITGNAKVYNDGDEDNGIEALETYFSDGFGNKVNVGLYAVDVPNGVWELAFTLNGYFMNTNAKTSAGNYLKILNTVIAVASDCFESFGMDELLISSPPFDDDPVKKQKLRLYQYLANKFRERYNVHISGEKIIIRKS